MLEEVACGCGIPIAYDSHAVATLRSDEKLFRHVKALAWRGPTDAFAAWTERAAAPRLLDRQDCAGADKHIREFRRHDAD